MSDDRDPVLRLWVAEPPPAAVRQNIERLCRAPDVLHVAVMPDVHLAAGVNNGVAVATRHLVYPAAVGGDIGCGFATVAFEAAGSQLARRQAAEAVLEALPTAVPIMRHRRRDGLPELAEAIDPQRLSAGELAALAGRDGRLELGTVGRGNHFLELQRDEEDRLWVMVHSGSRAMGQHITHFHLKRATAAGAGLAWLDADDATGRAYLNDMAWARAYAAESRLRMLRAAAEVLADRFGIEADWSTLLDTDHNHVQQEEHAGRASAGTPISRRANSTRRVCLRTRWPSLFVPGIILATLRREWVILFRTQPRPPQTVQHEQVGTKLLSKRC